VGSPRTVEAAPVHYVPGSGGNPPVRLHIGIVVEVGQAESEVTELMGDGAGVFALAHRRKPPLLRACQPARPFHIPGGDPTGHVRIGVAPFRRDVILCIEFHLAELLPHTCFIVAGINAEDGVIIATTARRNPCIGLSEGSAQLRPGMGR
jgi:hypothetical protein